MMEGENMGIIESALQQIQQNQLDNAGKLGSLEAGLSGVKADVAHIRQTSDRNTQQISEVKAAMARPSRYPALAGIVGKIWPIVIGLLVGAAAVGAMFRETLFQ